MGGSRSFGEDVAAVVQLVAPLQVVKLQPVVEARDLPVLALPDKNVLKSARNRPSQEGTERRW